MVKVIIDDGGRKAAGLSFTMEHCIARATAIATGLPYLEVLEALGLDCRSANPKRFHELMERIGWHYTIIPGGERRSLWRSPPGRIIASVDTHHVAVVDGVNHDVVKNYAEGEKWVYGYWSKRVLSGE